MFDPLNVGSADKIGAEVRQVLNHDLGGAASASKGWSDRVKRRSYKVIRARLARELGVEPANDLNGSDPLRRFIFGGAATIGAFQLKLNQSPGFREDGLSLVPGAVSAEGTVSDQLEMIMKDYHSRKWDVV